MGHKRIDKYTTVIKVVWVDCDDPTIREEEEIDISRLYVKDIEHFLDGAEVERNEEEAWEEEYGEKL